MKFSIRDLLLVTVIVALALGWLLDRSWLAANNHRLKMEADETRVSWDVNVALGERVEFLEDKLDTLAPGWNRLPNSSAPAPKRPSD